MRGVRQGSIAAVLLLSLLAAGGLEPTGKPATDPWTPERLSPSQAPAGEPPALERFSVDPRQPPASVGELIPVHAVVRTGPGEAATELHLTVDGPDGPRELGHASGLPADDGRRSVLVVAFWTPEAPGVHTLGGHVHVADQRLDLPTRTVEVEPASAGASEPATDGSTLPVGVAPGTVLWALVFMGLAFAVQLRHGNA